MFTPGIDFIATNLAKLAFPPLLFSATTRVLSQCFGWIIPKWMFICVMVFSTPFLLFIRIFITRCYHRYQARKLGARLPPEVQGSWLGNVDVGMRVRDSFSNDYLGEGFVGLMDSLGPVFNVRIGWVDRILITSPACIKRILSTEFRNFIKGKRLHEVIFPLFGNGVFNSDGDLWQFHRSITRPFFSKDRTSDFDIFDEHSHRAIELMKERLRLGHAVDFQDLMLKFALDSATAFLFGKPVRSLELGLAYPHHTQVHVVLENSPEHSKAVAFSDGFFKSLKVVSSREHSGWIWPLYEIWEDQIKEPMRQVLDYVDPIVKEAVERHQKECASGIASEVGEGATLLDHLVRVSSDPVLLRDETINILIAGRDTTSETLVFLVYCLAMYPSVMKRLRKEVLEKVGPTRRPDYDDIRDMKYLRAVINETLRLFAVVPFNARESVNAAVWPSDDLNELPIYIPAGTTVVYSVFLMHRRKDIWGPDAEEFDPDRFLDERLNAYLIKNPFIFVPFNAGPRICLGQQFSYNEMSFMVIRLLQQFSSISLDLEAIPPEHRPKSEWKRGKGRRAIEQVWPKTHVTTYASGGLWVRMQEADDT